MISIDLFKSVFLLYITIASGFVGDIFGCKIRKALNTNIYIKHILFFIMIYFTIILTEETVHHPLEDIYRAIKLWIFYIMMIRLDVNFTVIVFTLLIILFMLDEYIIYVKKRKKDKDEGNYKQLPFLYKYYLGKDIPYLTNISGYLEYIIAIITVIGFLIYLRKQYKDKGSKFSLTKFIFGLLNCGP